MNLDHSRINNPFYFSGPYGCGEITVVKMLWSNDGLRVEHYTDSRKIPRTSKLEFLVQDIQRKMARKI